MVKNITIISEKDLFSFCIGLYATDVISDNIELKINFLDYFKELSKTEIQNEEVDLYVIINTYSYIPYIPQISNWVSLQTVPILMITPYYSEDLKKMVIEHSNFHLVSKTEPYLNYLASLINEPAIKIKASA